MTADIKITADPASNASCSFTIDRPVYLDSSFYFANRERAIGSPLAERLFGIPTVSSVLISHNRIVVNKTGRDEWPMTARQIGAAIREHIASGLPPVAEELRASLPPADVIRQRVQEVIDTRINPSVAAHGGRVGLIGVQGNSIFLQLGGGCQGCGQANVTLKQGIEVEIRAAVPEVGDILDTTDHAAGRNPYYKPSGK
ncbi:MAG: NifU family protein [Planctomycetaceae bacterium]